jgi:methionyl-tRNA formyltransferase
MRIIFAGTPEFAAIVLDVLFDSGFDIALVLTQPDRVAGRGMRLRASSVKQHALAHGLKILQPPSLKTEDIQEALRTVGADVMVVAAYGLILPAAVLAIPARGCLNIHASLLPRWRGAAPIQRALLAGDSETGVTIMQMDAGLDTGAILLQEKTAIGADDTAQTVHDKLAQIGSRCIVQALTPKQPLPMLAQDETRATYADKITKSEARIEWTHPAQVICRQIRAFNPTPGAYTTLAGIPLKIWRAHALSESGVGAPGCVSGRAGELVVTTGDGTLAVSELQPAGGRRLTSAQFLAGHALAAGTKLGS